MHPKLRTVLDRVDRWCSRRGVDYDIACDEQDLQGLLLFRRHMKLAPELLEHLLPTLRDEGVWARAQRVRSGMVLAFSLRALSESELAQLTGERAVRSDFADRLQGVFNGTRTEPVKPPEPADLRAALLRSARELAETAFRFPTHGNSRLGHRRKPAPFGADRPEADPKVLPPVPGPPPRRGRRRAPGRKFVDVPGLKFGRDRVESLDRRIDAVLQELERGPGVPPTPGGAEGLQGMGAEHQPADLFQRFNAALQELGNQMAVGPLQEKLKQQGIKWKKSEDGQALIFFVTNGDTGAPQPIARVGAQTLAKPQEFQKALSQMLDFSKGQAPGTEEQKQQEVQDVQKRLREIATNMAPQDPEKQAAVMKTAAPPGVPAPAPAAGPGPGAAAPGGGGPGKRAAPAGPAPARPQNPKVSNLAAQARRPAGGGSPGPVGPRPRTAGRRLQR